MALLLIAWLNLVIQPCVAAVPAPLAASGHCAGGRAPPDHVPSCAAMQATACEIGGDLHRDAPQSSVAFARAGSLLPSWPSPADAARNPVHRAALRRAAWPATGPPLNILFCNLRN